MHRPVSIRSPFESRKENDRCGSAKGVESPALKAKCQAANSRRQKPESPHSALAARWKASLKGLPCPGAAFHCPRVISKAPRLACGSCKKASETSGRTLRTLFSHSVGWKAEFFCL